jgi:hypothetical protein
LDKQEEFGERKPCTTMLPQNIITNKNINIYIVETIQNIAYCNCFEASRQKVEYGEQGENITEHIQHNKISALINRKEKFYKIYTESCRSSKIVDGCVEYIKSLQEVKTQKLKW